MKTFIVVQDEDVRIELEQKHKIMPVSFGNTVGKRLYYYEEFPIEELSLDAANDPKKTFFRTNRLFFSE